MNDKDMLSILKNFDSIENNTANKKNIKINTASETQAMKNLLESLDAQQRSVHQMPSTHKMDKATAKRHPASKFLVGENEDEYDIDEGMGSFPIDSPSPLSSANQYSRKQNPSLKPDYEDDALDNFDLEEAISEPPKKLRTVKVTYTNGQTITTNVAADATDKTIYDYFRPGKRVNLGGPNGTDRMATIKDVEIVEDKIGPKQSFKELYKKMSAEEDEKEGRMAKDFYSKLQSRKKELKKGDSGKFDLSEDENDAIGNLKAAIDNLSYFNSEDDIRKEFKTNNGETYVALARKILTAVKELRSRGQR